MHGNADSGLDQGLCGLPAWDWVAAQLMRSPVLDRGSESATHGAYKVSPEQILAPTLFFLFLNAGTP